MKKAFRKSKKTISILLTVVMITASLSQSGTYVYAANLEDPETAYSLNESETEETLSVPDESESGAFLPLPSEPEAEETVPIPSESETEEAASNPSESETEETASEPNESGTEDSGSSQDESETESLPSQDESETADATLPQDDPQTEAAASEYMPLSETKAEKNYLIDSSYGYSISDVNVIPGSYSAFFSAIIPQQEIPYTIKIMYTTDKELANDFFPNVSRIKADELVDGFYVDVSRNEGLCAKQDENDKTYSEICWDFAPNSLLTPETTYYYRIVWQHSGYYCFMTKPGQFTTAAPIETSSVKIISLEAESIGYNCARLILTVDNPNHEYISYRYLHNTTSNSRWECERINGYTDDDGNIVPEKYFSIVKTYGTPLEIIPKLTVHTGISDREYIDIDTEISLRIDPFSTEQAQITADPQPGSFKFAVQLQITPWVYEEDFLAGKLIYRKTGDTDWTVDSFYLESATHTQTIQDLSPETDYEYYVTLTVFDSKNAEPFWSMGSEAQPLSFSTRNITIYEDSLFPDDTFRNYIKKQMGIPEDEPITEDKIDTLTTLYWSRKAGEDFIQSLEGIQYLTALESIVLQNHAIANADAVSSLTGLQLISLYNNELTEFPDLSGLSDLQTANFEKNKIASDILPDKLPAAFREAYPSWLSDTADKQRLPAKTPSQAEINAMYAEIPFDTSMGDTYAVKPKTTSPYAAGRLSDDTMNNALNMLNFSRFVAGVPSDVVLDDNYIELAQTGSLLNAVNGLSHTPEQPKGFPDDLYEKGWRGCSGSNLSAGHFSLAYNITTGWLNDGDVGNINRVGHRRWMLNPTMSATGFGSVDNYRSIYVFGHDKNTNISDFVAWPAQNMPMDLINDIFEPSKYPWSISLGSDYQTADASSIKVTLRDKNSGKTWTFSEKTSDFDGNYFSVNGIGYGSMGSCIIFRPKTSEVKYAAGSKFEVSVTGLKDRFGRDKSLSYTVTFFSLNKTTVSIRLSQSSLKMLPGDTKTLTATVTPEDTSGTGISWSSNNPDVATVDQNGTVTAIVPGDAVITATYKGKRATCKVAVRNYTLSRTELSFDLADGPSTETLTVSDGVNTVTDVTWRSTNEGVASVSKKDGSGIVTPTGSGTARIYAEIKDGPVFTCTVTVKKDVLTAISLNIQDCTLEKNTSRQLKIYYVPNDTTLSKEILWTSDNPEVASVDATGMVTALSKGTAVITAAVGTLTARCTVTVTETVDPAQITIPSGLQALTNVQTRLSDVSLKDYAGWEWENGDILLTQFAGMQEKSFAAVYHQEGYTDYKTALNVSLATLTGISITADKTTLGPNDTATADIQWKLSGSESVLSKYTTALQWSSSNPAVLGVTSTAPDGNTQSNLQAKASLQSGTTAGKATVTAQITLGSKTYTARRAFTVAAGNTAIFENISAEGLKEVTRDNTTLACYEGNIENQTGRLLVMVSNATKLTVKSSNTKVVTVGKVQTQSGGFDIPLTLKAAGMAKLTMTANDASKTKTEILLYVKDAKPNLSDNTITVNKQKTTGATLFIYPNDGYTVTSYELTGTDASLFEPLSPGSEPDGYRIKAKSGTAKGSYKLTVKVTTAANAAASGSYELPLTVKVTEQAPKYKITQSAKANLFYQDLGTPRITITSEETLTGLSLTGCDFKLTKTETDTANAYLLSSLTGNALQTSCNTKGSMELTFEGYETIKVPYTVKTENKKPKLALDKKTATLYPNAGITDIRLQIKSGGQVMSLDTVTATLQKPEGYTLTKTDTELTLRRNDLSENDSISRASTVKAEIALSCSNWAEAINLPLTVKINPGKPALRLQKTSLQLNASTAAMTYDMAETEVLWKDGAYFDPNTVISVSAANAKSQALIHDSIVFEQAGNKVIARLNNKDIATGSYQFKVHAIGISATPASLTVKVVNPDLSKAVKLSCKGNIDVLNRKDSFVTVTPSLKSLNGNIIGVSLSGSFAHLFKAELGEDQKIRIYAKETDAQGRPVALITKYNYSVNLVLTLQNAEGDTMRFTTSEIKLKLKQSKPKTTVTPKNAIFFSGAYNRVNLTMNASLKGFDAPEITDIELVNYTDLFDYSDGVLTLQNTGAAAKGKTYPLQFKITFKNQADNEKATIVKVPAKIK